MSTLVNAFADKLELFKEKYSNLIIHTTPIDITDCFLSDTKNRYIYPYSYGNLEIDKIFAYVVLGGNFVEKYAKDNTGKLIRDSYGHPIISMPFTLEMDILSSICVYDLRNTSLHEIKKPLDVTRDIQGYRRWHLTKIIKKIKRHHVNFDVVKDTIFIFAGKEPDVIFRLELNALWLYQIINYGKNIFLSPISQKEKYLIEKIFPEEIISGNSTLIIQRSYMYGKEHHNPYSVIF